MTGVELASPRPSTAMTSSPLRTSREAMFECGSTATACPTPRGPSRSPTASVGWLTTGRQQRERGLDAPTEQWFWDSTCTASTGTYSTVKVASSVHLGACLRSGRVRRRRRRCRVDGVREPLSLRAVGPWSGSGRSLGRALRQSVVAVRWGGVRGLATRAIEQRRVAAGAVCRARPARELLASHRSAPVQAGQCRQPAASVMSGRLCWGQ